MRHVFTCGVLAAAAVLSSQGAASGSFFSDDFDDLAASTRFSGPFFSAETGSIDGLVDYAFDYGTLGIPAAPNTTGGTTIGLGVQVNNTNDPVDEGEAIGVSPIIASLPDNYSVFVDAFIYYGGGSGSSEHAVVGVNADETAVPFTFVPAGAGQFYHVPHNSGLVASFPDDYYRVADGAMVELYNSNAGAIPDPEVTGVFPADGSDPYFNDAGYPGNQWMTIELTRAGGTLLFKIDGVLLDSYAIGGGADAGSIVFGGADIYNSANATNWIVYDNVRVVPEPATLSLLSAAGLAVLRRRR